MIKREITYLDFNEVERTETFYFNIRDDEIIDRELKDDGFAARILGIVNEKDPKKIVNLIKWFVDMSYGEKSEDGRSFMKSPEILARFRGTGAYEKMYMDLLMDAKAAADFINGLFPKERLDKLTEFVEKKRAAVEAENTQSPLPSSGDRFV